jgi:tetrahydromethanopterin S-methyltransferase subunit G
MSIPEDGLGKQIYASMQLKETGELMDIYLKQDGDEWSELALSVTAEILTERLGYLPALPEDAKKNLDPLTNQQFMRRLLDLEERQTVIWEEIRDRTGRGYIVGVLSLGIFLGLVGTFIFLFFLFSLIN